MFGVGTVLAGDLYIGSTPMDQVFLGDAEIWRRAPSQLLFTTTPGSNSLVIPDWVLVLDGVLFSGGTGGTGGSGFGTDGYGGRAGNYNTFRWVRTVAGAVTVNWTIGDGGAGGVGSTFSNQKGFAGGNTSVTHPGGTVTANGATGESSSTTGATMANVTFNGFTYPGGPGGTRGNPGTAPAGGGGGGKPGARGGPGALYLSAASLAW